MERYSLSLSFTVRMAGHILRFTGAAVCIAIAALLYPASGDITGIIAFCVFALFGMILFISFIAGIIADIRNRGEKIEIDGENIIFLDGNKRTAHTFAEITQVCADNSVHPDKNRMWICFGKDEQYPFYTNMKNADRFIEKMKEYGIKGT